MNSKRITKLAWTNLIALVLTLAINYLGATGYINGLTQKEVSDMYPTLITPAPFAFSIWGVIYVLLLGTIVYMIMNKRSSQTRTLIDIISSLFILSCALNAGWIVSFSFNNQLLSVILILGLSIVLAIINKIILDNKDLLKFRLPSLAFSIYGGWVTVATVVNVSALLIKIGWNRFGIREDIMTIITLAIAVLLVAFIAMRLKSPTYILPVIWAFVGMLAAHRDPNLLNNAYPTVQLAISVGIGALAVVMLGIFKKNRYCILPRLIY